ncbi:MAG: ATP synthase F1 subunit gamma [Candidatus Paceibacterota bacterium]
MPASTKQIKGKIQSVDNIKQITKAMQLVSVSKMRRAADRVVQTREYANRAREILENLTTHETLSHPLLTYNDTDPVLAIVVASDKSLCGSFNANVKKTLSRFIQASSGDQVDVVAVGKHSQRMARQMGCEVVASYSDFSEHVSVGDVGGIFEFLYNRFTQAAYRRVVVIYSHYESTLSYKPLVSQLLPVDAASMGDTLSHMVDRDQEMQTEIMSRYLFEPSEETVLSAVIPRLTKVRLFQALMESQASEHSARMFAMKNATENAEEVSEDLEQSYNRARQQAVTQEISEIAAASDALA